MGIVRDIITPILPVALGIAIGAGGSQAWGWYRYTQAINAELAGRADRDALVKELAKAKMQRDNAQAQAKQERGAIYAKDADAATWAKQPVPRAIAERMQRDAKPADSATGTTSGERLP